jgi:photosystem II stability/assembly factor-like uncharacterized protein
MDAAPPSLNVPVSAAFWDARHGLVGTGPCYTARCGSGTILSTSDGGRTFQVVVRTRAPVIRMQTAGRNGAIAELASGGALRSEDSGRTWHRAQYARSPFGTSFATSRLALGLRQCMGCRSDAIDIATTSDGGARWRYQHSPCPRTVVASALVDLVSERLGWLVCLGQPGMGSQAKAVYRTFDGARSWLPLARQGLLPGRGDRGGISSYGYPRTASFASDGFGLLSESRGTLFVTQDAGVSWVAKPRLVVPEQDEGYDATAFPDGKAVVLFRHGGNNPQVRLATTRDYGRTWMIAHRWNQH